MWGCGAGWEELNNIGDSCQTPDNGIAAKVGMRLTF